MTQKEKRFQIAHWLRTIYHQKWFSRVFPTTVSLLQRELADCKRVLDLGCGSDSPIQFCSNIEYSVGVDVFDPYINQSQRKGIHTKYIKGKIQDVRFPRKSFDAVLLIDVLEHLSRTDGERVIVRAQQIAKKKVIVVTPNGYIFQSAYDKNQYQQHRSGWTVSDLKNRNFVCYGLAGLRFLRRGRTEDTEHANLTTSIRFRPKTLWLGIAMLSHLITFHFPAKAFSLFCVKHIDQS